MKNKTESEKMKQHREAIPKERNEQQPVGYLVNGMYWGAKSYLCILPSRRLEIERDESVVPLYAAPLEAVEHTTKGEQTEAEALYLEADNHRYWVDGGFRIEPFIEWLTDNFTLTHKHNN